MTTFNHAEVSEATRWTGRLDEIGAPTLIIHETEDIAPLYAHGHALQAALHNSCLLTPKGSDHELHPLDWPILIDSIVEHTASA